MSQDEGSATRRARAWLLTIACLSVLLVVSAMIALNTALADIARDTLATQAQLTWIIDAYTLALACLLLLGGALGDRDGRRGALIVGLAVFAAASLLPVYFDSPTGIIVGRTVAGVGAAFVLPATLSLLTGAFPRAERTKAVGVWAGVAGVGALVGFLGAGLLLETFTWRAVFWAFALAAATLALLALTVSSSRDEAATPVDWIGGLLVGAALAALVLGLVEIPAQAGATDWCGDASEPPSPPPWRSSPSNSAAHIPFWTSDCSSEPISRRVSSPSCSCSSPPSPTSSWRCSTSNS